MKMPAAKIPLDASYTITYNSLPLDEMLQKFVQRNKIRQFSELQPKKIYYNNRTTVVEWGDGTKTQATCGDGETFSEEVGFLEALARKVYGARLTYLRNFEKIKYRQPSKEQLKLKTSEKEKQKKLPAPKQHE
jgi:hypothetical protein